MEKKEELKHWFVNIQHNPTSKNDAQDRNWYDMIKYGFWGANGMSSSGVSNRLLVQKLSIGDQIFAYCSKGFEKKRNGFVGYGIVKDKAIMARDFIPHGFGKKLFELPLECPNMKYNEKYPVDNEDLGEWVVRIQWKKTFTIENSIYEKGLFISPLIACQLEWDVNTQKPKLLATIKFLKTNFGLVDFS